MRFFMDYDNIPNQGPLMLFKDNGDGTSSLATPEDVNLAIAEATACLQKLCEEQRVEIANLRQIIGSLDVDDPKATDALLETMKMQKSQLATQTERVMVMREALIMLKHRCDCLVSGLTSGKDHRNYCVKFITEQALGQERLGDGR